MATRCLQALSWADVVLNANGARSLFEVQCVCRNQTNQHASEDQYQHRTVFSNTPSGLVAAINSSRAAGSETQVQLQLRAVHEKWEHRVMSACFTVVFTPHLQQA